MKEIFESSELDNFTIGYRDQDIPVQRMEVAKMVIYRVGVNGSSPLIVTRVMQPSGEKFWTSVPEGRQKEAEIFGPLIGEYILSKQ